MNRANNRTEIVFLYFYKDTEKLKKTYEMLSYYWKENGVNAVCEVNLTLNSILIGFSFVS